MKSADLFTPQSLSEAELLRQIKRKKREKWEDLLASQIKASGLPPFIREHPFAKPERMWRLDFAQLEFKVYVEIQGAIHGRPVVCNRCKTVVKTFNATTGKSFVVMTGGGRHSRPDGMRDDAEKAAALAIRGWSGFPCTPDQVESGAALDWLTQLLIFRGWQKGGSSGQETREGERKPEAEVPVRPEREAPTGTLAPVAHVFRCVGCGHDTEEVFILNAETAPGDITADGKLNLKVGTCRKCRGDGPPVRWGVRG